jgi:acyl-CoA synthetase (AMP-forming)/AMP-acid ligase II
MSIYVGNLSFDVTEADVREVFAEYGTVKQIYLPTDRETGRFRGFAFVTLETEAEEGKAIAKQLRDHIAKEIGPIAKPKDIRFGENLPKTRSGKIMRRLLRSLAKGEAITQDISTLENPAILGQLGQAY